MRRKGQRLAATAMALVLITAACGDDSGDDEGSTDTTDAPATQASIGEGEGALSVLAWPYYAEDGSFTDPASTGSPPFEEDTGCDTTVKYFGTSDEAYQLFASGDYDVVSASGDSSMRSVADGDAAADQHRPDRELRRAGAVPEGAGVEQRLDGTVYGVPARLGRQRAAVQHRGRRPGARRAGAPSSTPDSPYAGKIAAYDSPIYIADAALYLMDDAARPRDREPVRARSGRSSTPPSSCSRSRSRCCPSTGATTSPTRTTSGPRARCWARAGRSSPTRSRRTPARSRSVLPEEGSTAWSDNWMVYADAEHPNCAYEWINYITSAAGAGHGGRHLR